MDQELKRVIADFKAYLEQEKKKGLQAVPKSARRVAPAGRAVFADTGKAEALKKLYQQYAHCQNCPLGRTRTKLVFGEGDPQARLMFIGEGPGYEEDRTGRPFVGPAGQLLNKAIEATIGLKREEVYIGNVVKCHPMKNPHLPDLRGNDRPPTAEEAHTCFPIIKRQIEIIQPAVVCLLGNSAAQQMLETSRRIMQMRGEFNPRIFGHKTIQFIATLHPAACLYHQENKKYVWEDFKKIRDFLKRA